MSAKFVLPESVEDFNNKYRDTLGVITYKPSIQNREVTLVALLHGYRDGVLDFNTLTPANRYTFQSASGEGEPEPSWVAKKANIKTVTSLNLRIPELGYFLPPNRWPVYVTRSYAKSIRRGYNPQSISVHHNALFGNISRRVIDSYIPVRNSIEASLVYTIFKKQRVFKALSEVKRKSDMFALLSPDFLGVNVGDEWLLMYQNLFVGSLFPLSIDKSISGILDAFYDQVTE